MPFRRFVACMREPQTADSANLIPMARARAARPYEVCSNWVTPSIYRFFYSVEDFLPRREKAVNRRSGLRLQHADRQHDRLESVELQAPLDRVGGFVVQ